VNQMPDFILAASDWFSLVILIAVAAVSLLGKLFGKKKDEAPDDRSVHDEEIVEIDLGDLLGMHESAPLPKALPAQSFAPPPPLPNNKQSRHQATPIPVPELRIARRSRKKSRSATKPKQINKKSSPRASHVRVSDPSADETGIVQPNRSLIRGLLTSHPASLRGSFLIAELLAPPVALRDPSAPSMGPPGSAINE